MLIKEFSQIFWWLCLYKPTRSKNEIAKMAFYIRFRRFNGDTGTWYCHGKIEGIQQTKTKYFFFVPEQSTVNSKIFSIIPYKTALSRLSWYLACKLRITWNIWREGLLKQDLLWHFYRLMLAEDMLNFDFPSGFPGTILCFEIIVPQRESSATAAIKICSFLMSSMHTMSKTPK